MENDAHRIALRQLTAAVIRAQAAQAARQQARQAADEVAGAAQDTAADRRSNALAWAEQRLDETRLHVERGAAALPQDIDAAYVPLLTTPTLDARPGLQTAAHNAQVQAAGIQDGGRKLLLWKARRASIMSGIGVAVLVAIILLGLGVSWVVARQRHETTTARQTVAAAPSQTAAAATAEAATPTKEKAIALTTPAADDADGQPAMDGEPEDESTPTITPTRPTRTPRPPPTAGPTPTSFAPGAVVCPGASPTRLVVGDRARVINYQLNVRSGPGTHHGIVRRLDPGRTVDILDGPVCDDGQLWYYVISEEIVPRDGSTPYRAEGWLVEESGDTYYLEQIQ